MATLIVKVKDRELQRLPITKTVISIGREPANDLVIDNPTVSRFHVKVRYADRRFSVENVSSNNALLVNGVEVEKHPLRFGDILTLGKFEVEFSSLNDIHESKLIPVVEKPKDMVPTSIDETFHVPLKNLEGSAGEGPHRQPVPVPIEEKKKATTLFIVIGIVAVLAVAAVVLILLR